MFDLDQYVDGLTKDRRASLEDRLVILTRRISSGCVEWRGAKSAKGYGVMTLRVAGGAVTQRAHRISFVLFIGRIASLCVLHKCDNPSCISPSHLWCGTVADNNADMLNKGRAGCGMFYGTNNINAVLDEGKVRFIRASRANGTPRKALAAQFGVSVATIDNVAKFRKWAWLT